MVDIEAIKRRVGLRQFAEQRWGMRFAYAGKGRHKALCPLHQEDTPSFVVYEDGGWFCFGACNRGGDVLDLLEAKEGLDFRGALEEAARAAGVELEGYGEDDRAAHQEARAAAKALGEAMRILEGHLQATPEALAYCLHRGWTKETIRDAHLGYAPGRETLARELRAAGVDVGARGAKAALAIPAGMLVYPHIERGRVTYLSGRMASREEKRHYNPPNEIAGPRQPYWNWVHGDEVVIVEGQADAITLGQWGIPAVALAGCGLAAAAERGVLARLAGATLVSVWPDADGKTDVIGLGAALGPLMRVMGHPPEAKDANEWLQKGAGPEDAKRLIAAAVPFVVVLARDVGATATGNNREAELRKVFRVIAEMDEFSISAYREQLCTVLGVGFRQFNALLKSLREEKEAEKKKDEALVFPVPMVGGYINDYLFELVYLPPNDTVGGNGHSGGETWFAVRTPEGEIKRMDWIEFDYGVRYVPILPSKFLSEMIVEFPTDIGPLLGTRALVQLIRQTIHKYVEVDSFFETLAAYYVLFTWLYDCFNTVPYLRALGDYGTGKSRLKDVVGAMCYRPIKANAGATISPIFRTLDRFRGTLLFDEGDFRYSDESSDFVKMFNVGYQRRQGVILRSGTKEEGFDPEVFVVYGPKILATRKEFQDKALESRCLTKRMEGYLTRDDIPLEMPNSFYDDEAVQIRNMLLRYRLEHWKPAMEPDERDLDRSVEPRLNQVTMGLKAIVDEDGLRDELNQFIREYNRELITDRGMTAASKVLEAILLTGPDGDLTMQALADQVNQLMDRENYGDEAEDGQERGGKRMSARGVGSICKGEFGLQRARETKTRRYAVVWDEKRLQALQKRFGLDDETLAQSRGRTSGTLPGFDDPPLPPDPSGARDEVMI